MTTTLKQWVSKQLRYSPHFYRRLRIVQQERDFTAQQVEQARNERFRKLVHRAYHHSPFYRQLYDQAGVNLKQIQTA